MTGGCSTHAHVSDEPLLPLDPDMIPVDTPPWWRVAKRAWHFHTGMSRGDHRGSTMFASSLCVDDIYDTTILAHHNAGHTFADHLLPDERAALLEYRETL